MSWEIISGICAIIGVVYLIYQYHYLPKKEIEELKNHLLLQFKMNQSLTDKLINHLLGYATLNNAFDFQISPGITIFSYTQGLQQSLDNDLSEDKYVFLQETKLSKMNMNSVVKSLEAQFEALNMVYNTYTRLDRSL